MGITLEQARSAKEQAQAMFNKFASLAGMGITKVGDNYAVKVNLTDPPTERLPSEIDGVPLVVEVVGTIRKLGRTRSEPQSGAAAATGQKGDA